MRGNDEITDLSGIGGSSEETELRDNIEAPESPSRESRTQKLELFNVIYLGLTFCVMFSAFSVAQNFATSDDRPVRVAGSGYWSLSLLYFSFCSTTMFSGWLVKMMGSRISLGVGSVFYVLFVAANIYPAIYLLLPSAVMLGFGAALLWTAQGTYLSQNSRMETMSRNSGVFFSIFMLNMVIGNFAAGGLLALFLGMGWSHNASMNILFILMTVLCVTGAAMFIGLRAPPRAQAVYVRGTLGQTAKDILHTLQMFTRPHMVLLMFTMIYSGLSQSYFYGMFPKHVTEVAQESYVGYTLGVFGIADTLGSFAFGRVSEYASRITVFFIGAVLSTLGMCGAYFSGGAGWSFALLWVSPFVMGLSDSVFNTQIYAVVGTFCPKPDAEAGFAFFRLIQSGSTAASFFYSSWLASLPGNWGWAAGNLILLSALTIAMVTLALLQTFVRTIEVPKLDKPQNQTEPQHSA